MDRRKLVQAGVLCAGAAGLMGLCYWRAPSNSSIRAGVTATAPGKIILFGEHSVVYHGNPALAAALSDLRTTARVQPLRDAGGEGNQLRVTFEDFGSLQVCWTAAQLEVARTAFAKSYSAELSHEVSGDHARLPMPPMNISASILTAIHALCEESFITIPCPDGAGTQIDSLDPDSPEHKALEVFLFLYLSFAVLSERAFRKQWTTRGDRCLALEASFKSTLPIGAGLGSSASYCVSAVGVLWAWFSLMSVCDLQRHTGGESDRSACEVPREFCNRWAYQAEVIVHGTPSGIDNSVAVYGGALMYTKQEDGQPAIKHLRSMPKLHLLVTNTRQPRSTKALVKGVRDLHNRNPELVQRAWNTISYITREAAAAFERNESAERLRSLLEDSVPTCQEALRSVGVSHPTIERVCATSEALGLHTKLTGAGGGGCVFTVLHNEVSEHARGELVGKLEREFGPGCCFPAEVGGSGLEVFVSNT